MSNTGRLFAQNPFRTPVAQPNLPRLGAVDWGLVVAHAGADLEDEGAGDLQELEDFGDSLLRRLCLDAVAVGDHAPFGEVPTDRVFLLLIAVEGWAGAKKRAWRGVTLGHICDLFVPPTCMVLAVRPGYQLDKNWTLQMRHSLPCFPTPRLPSRGTENCVV